jgi:hypothetical protein
VCCKKMGGLHVDMEGQRICESLYQAIILVFSVRIPEIDPSSPAIRRMDYAPAPLRARGTLSSHGLGATSSVPHRSWTRPGRGGMADGLKAYHLDAVSAPKSRYSARKFVLLGSTGAWRRKRRGGRGGP